MAVRAAALVTAVTATLLPAQAQAQASLAELDRRIDQAAHQLETVVEQYNETRVVLHANQERLDRLRATIVELDQQLADRHDQVGQLLASTYRVNGSRPVVTLLSTASAEHFVDQLLMADVINRDHERSIAGLRDVRDRSESARRAATTLVEQQQLQEQQLAAKRQQIENDIRHLTELRNRQQALLNRSGASAASRSPAHTRLPAAATGAAAAAVAFAHAQLGKPYRWGSAGPNSYDCSGLTSAAWAKAGVRLPHNARRQFGAIPRVGRDQLRPGDLVFFYSNIQHVGIYIGAGQMIHSPRHGEVVRVDRIDYMPIRGYGRPG
ncbi:MULTISPECIES: NlpC/P60 family protein [unclassified Solwaraspora]|uniref:C40 family peptidase n=1 Tax=unclassified Solwaraspora TaxID=2627926 RepID=UPI00259B7667|nr:C40 family peptidase [Solwaraspora sp. WMMA2056]WJK42195.1 NlpC/P60 family protein [Solwaraspora sp. WMMA2056]